MRQRKISTSEPSQLFRRIASIPSLYQAWRKVRANRGAAGSDAVSILAFEKNLESNLTELSRNLLDRSYEPLPSRCVIVPKPKGIDRHLSIPCVRDRIAQRALLDSIEPSFERQFLDCSFAFRQGRSVETAVQRIVTARANGYVWTLDADVKDFFPSISHEILMSDISRVIDAPDVLRIISQWLNAGVLEQSATPGKSFADHCISSAAAINLAVRDAVSSIINDYVSDRLGEDYQSSSIDNGYMIEASSSTADEENTALAAPLTERRRSVLKRVVESGVLLALTERAIVSRLISAPVLGVGGAALAAAAIVPYILRKLRLKDLYAAGAPQGSPVSPLFSNIYLHAFDGAMNGKAMRLIRYCDDFLVLCRTKAEASDALRAAKKALAERRLQIHSEKTRIVAPDEPFDFLGYGFAPDGSIAPPASLPQKTVQRVMEMASRAASRTAKQSSEAAASTKRGLARLLTKIASKLE